jgi:hypothetical protein
MGKLPLAIVLIASCSRGGGGHADPDGAPPSRDSPTSLDGPVSARDDDGDGLSDALELQLAIDYMPFVSMDPSDGCALDGMIVRVRPHPADPTKILIVYDHVFQNDCGLGGHIGDDEVFGIAIDPSIAAPAGILAIKAASHQGTACERDTECTTCSGDSRSACELAADGNAMWPVLYASKDKHGQYATKCSTFTTCLDQCTLNAQRVRPPVVNAGEPGHPLVTDLTTQGFVTAANGWTEASLQHFDPWDQTKNFGGAGNVAGDLQDAAFEAAPCH